MANLPVVQIGKHLEKLAKKHMTCYYSDITAKFGLPFLDGAWDSHDLSKIFEILDQEDADKNRPFRTSVVISKEFNKPGPGYFAAMSRFKSKHTSTETQRDALWLNELSKTFAYKW